VAFIYAEHCNEKTCVTVFNVIVRTVGPTEHTLLRNIIVMLEEEDRRGRHLAEIESLYEA
jgi:hypothetical protein